jgi:hypothetical protein
MCNAMHFITPRFRQVLDYDYAPCSQIVEGRRMYINVSQEGKADVDFLREEGLINGLKISSKGHLPVTMFQVGSRGVGRVRCLER